jgi:hypothetical protein
MSREWQCVRYYVLVGLHRASAGSYAGDKITPALDLIEYWNNVCRLEASLWKSLIRVERPASSEMMKEPRRR